MMQKATVSHQIQALIQDIIDQDLLVIVEGKKDKHALKELGITRIITFCALHKLLEKVAHEKQVVVLTDLDKEGKHSYGKIKDLFSRHGIFVNDNLRNFLYKYTQLKQIEGLPHYLDKLE